MPTPWIDRIRSTGQLRIYLDSSLGSGWRSIVDGAITSFNAISGRERLAVQLSPVTASPAGSGADVGVYTIDGNTTFRFDGTDYPVSLPGSAMQGTTKLVIVGSSVEKAFVYLPAGPLGNTPRGRRAVGNGVRSVIAFHELVHCCGLSNADHGSRAFHGTPSFDSGRTAADDRLSVGSGRHRVVMPPLTLDSDTCRLIRTNWS